MSLDYKDKALALVPDFGLLLSPFEERLDIPDLLTSSKLTIIFTFPGSTFSRIATWSAAV